MDHEHEQFRQDLRKSFSRNLFQDSLVVGNGAMARNVDAEAVNSCRLRTFRQLETGAKRMAERSEEYDSMEKARDARISEALLQDRADARQIGLDQYVQKMYFDYYGHGYDGGPVCDRPGAPWVCPGCGLKVMMSMKLMRTTCPRCRHITPIGELKRDGVLKR